MDYNKMNQELSRRTKHFLAHIDEPAGQGPYGQDARGYDPYGQGAKGHDPYGQGPKGHDPYGQGPRGHDPYGQGPRGHDSYGQGPRGHGPYGQGPKGHDSYGQGPKGHDTYGQGPKGHDTYGQGPKGHEPYGQGGYRHDPYGQGAEAHDPERQRRELEDEDKKQKLIKKFQAVALDQGCNKIMSIGRKFRYMDNDGNKTLSKEEFVKGCMECITGRDKKRPKMTVEELELLFDLFDKDKSGALEYEEFLFAIRFPMNKSRQAIVNEYFDKMNENMAGSNKDGVITVEDIAKTYDAKKHPKYLNGEMTERQVLSGFLVNFEADDRVDGRVTRDEFLDYYSGVSASIDDDSYFALMMRNSWKFLDKKKPKIGNYGC